VQQRVVLICIVGLVLPQVRLKQEPQGQPQEPQEPEPPPELVLDYRLAGQLSLVWRAH
jgi:hypothetical protein